MIKSAKAFISLLVLGASPSVEARPVSYADGWTLMQKNNWERNRLHVHYSPNAYHSFGLSFDYIDERERYNTNFQWNHLMARKNTKHSQANLYLKTQFGIASQGDTKEPNVELGIAGDWETRRYFTSYSASTRYADSLNNGSFYQEGRIGIAPYIGGYNALHTWLMLQVEHHPEALDDDNQLIITPLVRLFKGDYLIELGINNNGDPLFNWVVRF